MINITIEQLDRVVKLIEGIKSWDNGKQQKIIGLIDLELQRRCDYGVRIDCNESYWRDALLLIADQPSGLYLIKCLEDGLLD